MLLQFKTLTANLTPEVSCGIMRGKVLFKLIGLVKNFVTIAERARNLPKTLFFNVDFKLIIFMADSFVTLEIVHRLMAVFLKYYFHMVLIGSVYQLTFVRFMFE